MNNSHESLLKKYLQLPDRLEAAVAGLSEADLDLTMGQGWSIRAYIHHTVEGEAMWEMFLRVIAGRDGAEFPIQWYFAISQDEWARHWIYDKRPIGPTLAVLRANTRNMSEYLRLAPPQVWKHYGRVTWPGAKEKTRFTVRDIILMNTRHVNQHVADIQAILQSRNIERT